MLEFSAISVSSYEATSLVDRLNESASAGWTVVSIVPTGSTVTAYLSREAGSTSAPVTAATASVDVEPATFAPAISPDPVPVAAVTQIIPSTPTPAATTPAAATPAATTPAATTGGAPAGWYADPSGRFDLRYWNGDQWTEYVSRAGQQFTDPPVA
jgi:hypothetical protein